MSDIRDINVLVVGLGPAGSRAAFAAATRGYRVLAIDRKREAGWPVQCAEFVPTLVSQELDGLDAVTSQAIETMTTKVEDDTPDLTDGFRGRMIDRRAFDGSLVDRAIAAGADCRFGLSFVDFGHDGAVGLGDGTQFTPRIVIAADGPRSRVGRSVGRVNRDIVETRQITVRLTAPGSATEIFLAAGIRGGYAWLFPKGGIANLGIGVSPDAKPTLKPLLEQLHGTLQAEGRVGSEILAHTGGVIPVGGMLDPVAALGDMPVLLAGDAAGLANPVTGAGIASAVMSGALAGEAAAAWLGGNRAALADYGEELDDVFGVALARALNRRRELLASFETGDGPTPAALRRGWIGYPEYWAA